MVVFESNIDNTTFVPGHTKKTIIIIKKVSSESLATESSLDF